MLAVHIQAVLAGCSDFYTAEQMNAWFLDRDESIYQDALRAKRVWLAEDRTQLLGFVSTEPGEVTLLFVAPEASGRQIGTRLLAQGLSQAAVDFIGPIQVVATMNSVSFYARHGFSIVGEEFFERGTPALRYPVVRMVQSGLLAVRFAATEA